MTEISAKSELGNYKVTITHACGHESHMWLGHYPNTEDFIEMQIEEKQLCDDCIDKHFTKNAKYFNETNYLEEVCQLQ